MQCERDGCVRKEKKKEEKVSAWYCLGGCVCALNWWEKSHIRIRWKCNLWIWEVWPFFDFLYCLFNARKLQNRFIHSRRGKKNPLKFLANCSSSRRFSVGAKKKKNIFNFYRLNDFWNASCFHLDFFDFFAKACRLIFRMNEFLEIFNFII